MYVVQYLSDANRWLRRQHTQFSLLRLYSLIHTVAPFPLAARMSKWQQQQYTHTEKKKWKRRRRREWMNEWKKLYLIDLANLCTHSSKIRTRSHSFPDFFRPRCCRSSLFVIIALCVLTEFWSDIHLYVPMRNSVKHINGIGVHSNRNAERKKNAVWFFLSAIIPFVKSCSL